MADKISTLPVDSTPLNHNEITLMNALFENKNSEMINKAIYGLRDVLFASGAVLLILLPIVDEQVRKMFPVTASNPYMMVLVKTLIFAVLYFIMANANLLRAE
jgi:hypothetical protein